jgi:site-specific recombinase XerD
LPRKRLEADVLTRSDIEQLLRGCSHRSPTGIRNRALLATTWRCGLRIGEALALRPQDIDVASATLVVQHGKGDKRRVIGIDAGAAELTRRWIEVRKKLGLNFSQTLFCTLRGTEIDQSYVRHLLPRLSARAGVSKRVHAHALRHAFAVELEAEGAPLSTIRDALGHSTAAVTDRYLRRIGGGAATAFLRERSWAIDPTDGPDTVDA